MPVYMSFPMMTYDITGVFMWQADQSNMDKEASARHWPNICHLLATCWPQVGHTFIWQHVGHMLAMGVQWLSLVRGGP